MFLKWMNNSLLAGQERGIGPCLHFSPTVIFYTWTQWILDNLLHLIQEYRFSTCSSTLQRERVFVYEGGCELCNLLGKVQQLENIMFQRTDKHCTDTKHMGLDKNLRKIVYLVARISFCSLWDSSEDRGCLLYTSRCV